MKLLFFVFNVFIFHIFLLNSYGAQAIKCETNVLNDLPNTLYTPIQSFLEPGEEATVGCKDGFGVYEPDFRIAPSFRVKCSGTGQIIGVQNCVPACSGAQFLKNGYNFDISSTEVYLENGDGPYKMSYTKMAPKNAKIHVKCTTGFGIPNGSNTPEKKFIYDCKNPNPIQACTERLKDEFSKYPQSNVKGNYIPQYNCNLNELVLINAKIENSGNVQASVPPRTQIKITCNSGYGAYEGIGPDQLGYIITPKYTVTCDPAGSGKFLNTKACTPKCNATRLLELTAKIEGNSVAPSHLIYKSNDLENSIGTIDNKNMDSYNLMMDQFTTIRVRCKNGYEIRNLGQDYYFSSCLPGGFDTVEVCEKEIKPCDNSKIDLNGSILMPHPDYDAKRNKLTGTTRVGAELDVNLKCQGGNGYFESKKRPRCVYNKSTGSADWDVTEFQCYDGCITLIDGVKTKVQTKNDYITSDTSIKRYYSQCVTQYSIFIPFCRYNNQTVTVVTSATNMPDKTDQIVFSKALYNAVLFGKDEENIVPNFTRKDATVIGVHQKYSIYSCEARQTNLVKISNFGRNIGIMGHWNTLKNLGADVMATYNNVSGCSETKHHSYANCLKDIEKQYDTNIGKEINQINRKNLCKNIFETFAGDEDLKINSLSILEHCYGNAEEFRGSGDVCLAGRKLLYQTTMSAIYCESDFGSTEIKINAFDAKKYL